MMTIGIPEPQITSPKLTKRQRYLRGKRCYENCVDSGVLAVRPFKSLSKSDQRFWESD